MKKKNLITKVLLLMLMLVGSVSASWAEEKSVTISPSQALNDGGVDPITIVCAKGDGTSNPAISGGQLRLYQAASGKTTGNTITFSSDKTITKIVFTFANNMTADNGSFSVGSYDSGSSTWNGSTNSVTLTVTGTDGSHRIYIANMVVYYEDSGDTPSTYTVTYDGNGATSGSAPTDNNTYNPNDVVTVLGNTGSLAKTDYSFDGWNTKADGTGTDYAPNATFNISANTTLYAQWVWSSDGDLLDLAFTTVSGTNYVSWTDKVGDSGAVYTGNSAGGNNAIQLRSSNDSGIITTTSGGKVEKVTVVWNSNTQAGRTLDIYGKNSAYSATSDLYSSSTQGTKLGSIVYGTSTELNISGDYEYIGLRSNNGAMYLDKIIIKWEASSKTETTTTINSTGITNTDVYVSTAAGTLSAAVTETDSGDAISGATVTWSSSDTDVATIDASTGVVTLVAAGTTTITASYAGDDDYMSSSATYELTVTSSAPYVQPTEITIQMTNSLFNQDVHTSGTAAEDMTFVGTQDNVTVTYFVPEGSYYYFNTSNTRPYNTCTLTYGAPTGYVITKIDFTSDGQNWKTATPSVGEMTGTKVWEGSAESVTFSWKETGTRIKTVVVTLAESVSSVSLAPTKTYTTLTSAYNLDFTGLSLKAFIVLDNDASDGKVTMTQVNKVPAETGLVIKSENPGEAVEVPVFDGTGADDVEDNKMLGSSAATTYIAENEGYILKDGAFHPSNGEGVLAAGKAYLAIPVDANAPVLSMEFGGGTTGILNIERTVNDNQYYTLDGRRVAEPTKGLYIVNGRKVIVK